MMEWRPLGNFYTPSARNTRKNRYVAGKIIARPVEIAAQPAKAKISV
jgi:hypothetical protein